MLNLFKKPGYHPEGLFGSLDSGGGGGGVQVRGKWFKSQASANRYWKFQDSGGEAMVRFWQRYEKLDSDQKRRVRLTDPDFKRFSKFKYDSRKDRLALLYRKYPPFIVKEIATKLGLLDRSRENWTDAQWQTYLRNHGQLPEQQMSKHIKRSPRLARLMREFIRDFNYAPPKKRLALARGVA